MKSIFLWIFWKYSKYFQDSFLTSASILSNHNILCCRVGICIYIKDWLKKNGKEVVMSVQLNERWKQEQFDNLPAMKSASLSEQALKNEKRRIERKTTARELCFQNNSVVIFLRHSSYPSSPRKILQWIEMKTRIELRKLMYESINK